MASNADAERAMAEACSSRRRVRAAIAEEDEDERRELRSRRARWPPEGRSRERDRCPRQSRRRSGEEREDTSLSPEDVEGERRERDPGIVYRRKTRGQRSEEI